MPRSSRPPAPGVSVDGYTVQSVLGSGGQGSVALATDDRDRPVALKWLHPRWAEDEGKRKAFRREARTMARVSHPNVVTIVAHGTYERWPYLVMEYVEGGTLATWMALHRGNPPRELVLALLGQLAAGIDAIHEAGCVHGDLKPANVLLGPGLEVKVTDFGLGRRLVGAAAAEARPVAGTPTYLAPEVLEDVPLHLVSRRDIYAFGVIAYELLTGQTPFRGSAGEVVSGHVLTPPPPPSFVARDLPPAVDVPLLQLLAKDPKTRPGRASPHAAWLADLLEGGAEAPASAAPTLLLVDDDRSFMARCAEWLGRRYPSATIARVESCSAAFALAEHALPSLVLVELGLPGVAALVEALGRDTPVVAVSASDRANAWRRVADAGARQLLLKPIERAALVDAAHRALVRREETTRLE